MIDRVLYVTGYVLVVTLAALAGVCLVLTMARVAVWLLLGFLNQLG